MAAVSAKDVFFLYRATHGDVAALRGFSLLVEEGESVAVLGPSGAGKTTLLNLCAGLERPSSGPLSVLGHSFDHASARERARVRRASIGIVRQHYHLMLPHDLSIEEILALPLRLTGCYTRAQGAWVAELLRRSGLTNRAGARPAELSGGEQQRVAVCAALVKRPQLLLADEPTGELDARSSAAVIDLILELCGDTGATAVVVTHDHAVAHRASRTIYIRDGRLAAEGATRPVLIVDEQGWLRLPRRLRDEAGVSDRLRATASWGRIELVAEQPQRHAAAQQLQPSRLAPAEKRSGTEVAIDRVSKTYEANDVFDGLSVTFEPERFHVIAGPSGSGKTTLLNLIAALERPDAGEVWVSGERVDSLGRDEAARWRQRVLGFLSQHSTLVSFLSARENVIFPLTLRGFASDEAEKRTERWLAWAGLADLAERRTDRLSGGEQRRVALARALAPAPRLLIADEPTAHLDRVTGRLVVRLLREVAHDLGTTVIAASHDPDVISAADRHLVFPTSAWAEGTFDARSTNRYANELRREPEDGSFTSTD